MILCNITIFLRLYRGFNEYSTQNKKREPTQDAQFESPEQAQHEIFSILQHDENAFVTSIHFFCPILEIEFIKSAYLGVQ